MPRVHPSTVLSNASSNLDDDSEHDSEHDSDDYEADDYEDYRLFQQQENRDEANRQRYNELIDPPSYNSQDQPRRPAPAAQATAAKAAQTSAAQATAAQATAAQATAPAAEATAAQTRRRGRINRFIEWVDNHPLNRTAPPSPASIQRRRLRQETKRRKQEKKENEKAKQKRILHKALYKRQKIQIKEYLKEHPEATSIPDNIFKKYSDFFYDKENKNKIRRLLKPYSSPPKYQPNPNFVMKDKKLTLKQKIKNKLFTRKKRISSPDISSPMIIKPPSYNEKPVIATGGRSRKKKTRKIKKRS
jgi:hypothetical protein